MRTLVVALLASLCVVALPTASAFGEGSVDLNTGPGTEDRHKLFMVHSGVYANDPYYYTVLYVYARAGETVQLGSSAMGLGGTSNILVYAPGTDLEQKQFPTDPAFATDIHDCNASLPAGDGRIASRAEELAGPLPNAGGYTPCEFTPTQDGIYPIIMRPVVGDGTYTTEPVNTPDVTATQGSSISLWDITVRAGGPAGAVQPGRAFSRLLTLLTPGGAVSGLEVFPYTKTGHEWEVDMPNEAGGAWQIVADDMGVIDVASGQRTFESFEQGQPIAYTDRNFASPDRRFPVFFNRADVDDVISGDDGLGETLGYSPVPISQASNPISSLAFTGSAGQAGGTNRFSGGTVGFSTPRAMEGLGYSIALDLNGDGVFGNANDVVDATNELSTSGNNSFAWNGRDAAGNSPGCGSYTYRIGSTLGEVHFPLKDVEASGGKTFQRLTLPTDAALGDPLLASYNNIDSSKSPPLNVVGTLPASRTNEISGPGFNAWTGQGDNEIVDTWAQLPAVFTTGTLQVLCPDVEIVKSSTAPLVAGERATYRLVVTNNGPGTAVNVRASDELPSGVSFVSTSDGCSQADGTVTCTVASLPQGESRTFTVTVDVASSADGCPDVRNTATVTNDVGPDPEPINNTSTICNFEKRADLVLTKEASSATVAPGGQVMYTLVVRNRGPSDDTNVRVTDPVPAGLTVVSAEAAQGSCAIADGSSLSCNLGSLVSGGSTQILVTARLSGTECVTNTARVGGDAFDPNLANNTDDARICPEGTDPRFDLVVSKSVNKKNPLVGETVRYRVVVTNRGPDAAPSVTVKDTLNAPVDVVSVKASQGSCTKRIPMTCELGTIAAGGRVTITIRAKHREPATGKCSGRGGQRNAASATGDGTDTNPANNLDVVKVCPKVVLELTKKVSTSTVSAGQTFSYTIRVHNPSKVAVSKVRTCDRLPAGLAFVSATPKAKLSKGQHCWTAKTIGAGKSKTYKVTVRALSGASGRLLNTASASSPVTRTNRVRRPVQVLGQAVDPPQPTG